MKVSVWINYWRDLSILKLTLPSLPMYFEEIVIHDGRYEEFPDEGISSDDGIEEYCKKWDNVHYLDQQKVFKDQIEKRNVMFDKMLKGRWILVLDADELLINPKSIKWMLPPDGYILGKVREYTTIRGDTRDMLFGLWHDRLVKNVPQLNFEQYHFRLMYEKKAITQDWRTELAFMHLRNTRSSERREMQRIYYTTRKEGAKYIELDGKSEQEIEAAFISNGYFRVR